MNTAHALGPPFNTRKVLTPEEFMKRHGEEIRNGTFGKEEALPAGTEVFQSEHGQSGETGNETTLTGETITLPSGIVVSESSGSGLYLPQAVSFSTSHGGLLLTADLSMLVRDELDKKTRSISNGKSYCDFSDQYQITSTLCLFHKDTEGVLRMYASDLFSMYGNNPAKHNEVAGIINAGVTLRLNHFISCDMLRLFAVNRTATLPTEFYPVSIPLADLPNHPITKAIFPAQSQRFANYLQRRQFGNANFYLIGTQEGLDDPNQCLIRPVGLGGGDLGRIDYVVAVGGYCGRARAGSANIFSSNSVVSP